MRWGRGSRAGKRARARVVFFVLFFVRCLSSSFGPLRLSSLTSTAYSSLTRLQSSVADSWAVAARREGEGGAALEVSPLGAGALTGRRELSAAMLLCVGGDERRERRLRKGRPGACVVPGLERVGGARPRGPAPPEGRTEGERKNENGASVGKEAPRAAPLRASRLFRRLFFCVLTRAPALQATAAHPSTHARVRARGGSTEHTSPLHPSPQSHSSNHLPPLFSLPLWKAMPLSHALSLSPSLPLAPSFTAPPRAPPSPPWTPG